MELSNLTVYAPIVMVKETNGTKQYMRSESVTFLTAEDAQTFSGTCLATGVGFASEINLLVPSVVAKLFGDMVSKHPPTPPRPMGMISEFETKLAMVKEPTVANTYALGLFEPNVDRALGYIFRRTLYLRGRPNSKEKAVLRLAGAL